MDIESCLVFEGDWMKHYQFMDMITAGGGEIYACKLACDMFKVGMEDFNENVKDIITIGEFYELADGDRTQIIFT